MTRRNWSALALGTALLLVLGPACKKRGRTEDFNVLPVPEAREENGWPRYEIAAEGFAVALPPDWRQIDMSPEKFDSVFDEMTAKNPEFAPLLRGVRQQVGLKFFGFDPATAGTGFATNVNILLQDIPPATTLDAAVAETLRQMEGVPGVARPVAHERLTSATGDRERFRYRLTMVGPDGKRATVAITQYLAVRGGGLYIVTMTTLPGQEAKYAQTFEGIGRGFRFLE